MAYPDWVEKYRTKGKAINHVNGKYYLYAVHSERVKGTSKVKKITDAYLGRITEDGLIPPKSKIKGDIIVKEYGIYAFVLSVNDVTINRIVQDFPTDYQLIISMALINLNYGDFKEFYYTNSYMSVIYPNLKFINLSDDVKLTIERLTRMFKSNLEKKVESFHSYINLFRNVVMVYINKSWHLSTPSDEALKIIIKYDIKLRGLLWQK